MTKNAERYLKWVISISQLHHTEQRVAYFLAKFYSISGSIPNFLQWHYIYCFQRTKLIRWIVFSFNQFQKFIHFFPFSLQIRNTLSDFAIFFGIVICTCVDVILAVDTPKLTVPDKIKVQKQRKILITFLIEETTQ